MNQEMLEFKMLIAGLVDILIRDAIKAGHSTDAIFRKLGVECLELAARIHTENGGCDRSFLGMAQDLLGVVRTGARDQ